MRQRTSTTRTLWVFLLHLDWLVILTQKHCSAMRSREEGWVMKMEQVLAIRNVGWYSIVKHWFYRTLETSTDHVASIAHDGRGNNNLYLWSSKLELLATKRIWVSKDEGSLHGGNELMNLGAYIHKLQLRPLQNKLLVFGVPHRAISKVYVFLYDPNRSISSLARYKHTVPSNLRMTLVFITDFHIGNKMLLIVSRDRGAYLYNLKLA